MSDDNNTQPAAPTDVPAGVSPFLVILIISAGIGLLFAALALLAEGDTGGTSRDVTVPQSLRGWEAADFQLVGLDGELVRLTDFAGRPVFLNFWRTDCPPCVRELPAMQQFMREQGDTGAVVLAVNQGEDAGDVRAFLADLGITEIPILLDPDTDLARDYGYRGLPTTYIIDAEGRVAYQKIGEFTLEQMYSYLDAVNEQGIG